MSAAVLEKNQELLCELPIRHDVKNSSNYPYIQAFQVPAACEAHLGNNHFIPLNCHGQLSWLSVAIGEEKTVSVGRDYNNISFHSATDNEGPAMQHKTEEISVSTLHP